MAALEAPNHIPCQLSYMGTLCSEQTTVTAIVITTKTREIIANFPIPCTEPHQLHALTLSTPSDKKHSLKRLMLSRHELLKMECHLQLTSTSRQKTRTILIPVHKTHLPQRQDSKRMHITVIYPMQRRCSHQRNAPYMAFTSEQE